MIDSIEAYPNRGCVESSGNLGCMYRAGKGVEPDFDKVADKNVGWAKNELFDILWRFGTSAYEEMISVATKFAEKGNRELLSDLVAHTVKAGELRSISVKLPNGQIKYKRRTVKKSD